MTETWLLPLLLAGNLTPIALYLGYYIVLPRLMVEGYRQAMPSTQFGSVDGSEGAGSADIEYYTLYFDVRHDDLTISGPAPSARHWQIAAFDGMARLIDGAYVNHKTITLDNHGNFRVRLTARPANCDPQNILDCSSTPRGMVIFRVVLPRQTVQLPTVTRS